MPINPAELRVLKVEINSDPDNLGYAGRTDQQVADIINVDRQVGATLNRPINSKEIIDAFGAQKITQITDAAATESGVQAAPARSEAIRFDYYMTTVGAIDVGVGSQGRACLDALVVGGHITAGDVAGLVTLSELKVFTKRRKQLFSGVNQDITATDVSQARVI